MNQACGSFRSWYLSTIPQIIQKQNYLHTVDSGIPTGISLYDRKGNTNLPPEMSLPPQVEFTIKSDGPNNNMPRVNFTMPAATHHYFTGYHSGGYHSAQTDYTVMARAAQLLDFLVEHPPQFAIQPRPRLEPIALHGTQRHT
jgi:hypothetical protein